MKARSILPKLMTKKNKGSRAFWNIQQKITISNVFTFTTFKSWYERCERKICKNIIDYNITTSTTGSEEKSSHVGIDESNCRSYVDECT